MAIHNFTAFFGGILCIAYFVIDCAATPLTLASNGLDFISEKFSTGMRFLGNKAYESVSNNKSKGILPAIQQSVGNPSTTIHNTKNQSTHTAAASSTVSTIKQEVDLGKQNSSGPRGVG